MEGRKESKRVHNRISALNVMHDPTGRNIVQIVSECTGGVSKASGAGHA